MNIQEAFAEKTPVNHQHNAGGRKYLAEKRTGDWQLIPCSARAPQPSLTWGKAPRGRPMGWRPTTPAEAKPSQQVPVCWSPTILAHTAAVPHRPSLHPEPRAAAQAAKGQAPGSQQRCPPWAPSHVFILLASNERVSGRTAAPQGTDT